MGVTLSMRSNWHAYLYDSETISSIAEAWMALNKSLNVLSG